MLTIRVVRYENTDICQFFRVDYTYRITAFLRLIRTVFWAAIEDDKAQFQLGTFRRISKVLRYRQPTSDHALMSCLAELVSNEVPEFGMPV